MGDITELDVDGGLVDVNKPQILRPEAIESSVPYSCELVRDEEWVCKSS